MWVEERLGFRFLHLRGSSTASDECRPYPRLFVETNLLTTARVLLMKLLNRVLYTMRVLGWVMEQLHLKLMVVNLSSTELQIYSPVLLWQYRPSGPNR